jgi:hypothetical protein
MTSWNFNLSSPEIMDVIELAKEHDWDLVETLKDISDMIRHQTGIQLKLCPNDMMIRFLSHHDACQFDPRIHWDMMFSFLWGENVITRTDS